MHAGPYGSRRRRSPEIPWLLVATIAGIAVVVIVALLFFTGFFGASSSPSSPAVTVKPTAAASSSGAAGATKTPTIVIATTTPVTVPASGVTVKVDYLGGFSGTYTTNGETTKIKDSGTKIYTVTNATGSVTAVVQKGDNTATHALTVTIYKNGSPAATNSTSAANGKVTVTAAV
jgi:hypothetical protein